MPYSFPDTREEIRLYQRIQIGQVVCTVIDLAEEGQFLCLLPGVWDHMSDLQAAIDQSEDRLYWVSWEHLVGQYHKYKGDMNVR
jgi:hypothetical protein